MSHSRRLISSVLQSTSAVRSLCSSRLPASAGVTSPFPSLSHPIPQLDSYPYSKHVDQSSLYQTHVTKLSNGVTVVTEPKYGHSCTIGLAIDAGSRYEVGYPSGVCHMLEKLAYTSTSKFPDASKLVSAFEEFGAVWDAQCSRDLFIYAANCHVDGMHNVLELLADTAVRPVISDDELDIARQTVNFDLEDMSNRPEVEPILTDFIHQAAFRDNTVGLPKICPHGKAEEITRETLFAYLSKHFAPERICVVGVGISHSRLVESARQLLEVEKSAWMSKPHLLPSSVPDVDCSIAQYTGGELMLERDLSHIGSGTPYPNLAHVVIGLNGVSFRENDDYLAMSVLNALMGGGCHFSAGGPGKGMYTRLYTDCLNIHHWMYNATSYNQAYSDAGLYYIHASCDPERLDICVRAIVEQINRLRDGFQDDEVERAKAQLQSLLLMNLEMRPVQFEDTARMMVGLGQRKPPLQLIEEIGKVTSADLERVVKRMLSKSASVVGYGDLTKMPSYTKIDSAIANNDITLLHKKKSRFFG